MKSPAITSKSPIGVRSLRTSLCFVALLAPASVLAQPLAESGLPAEARVVSVRGGVEVLGGEVRSPRVGEVLGRGSRLRTGPDGSVVLAMPNGSQLELEQASLLTLFAAPQAAPSGAPDASTLSRGTMRVHMAPSGLRTVALAIATQAVTVWSGRSDAMISADLGGHITRMAVWRGRMRVRMGTREYLLTQGYGVQEEEGHSAGVLRLLPRAPVWREAPPARMLSFGEALDVSAVWAPNPRGAQALPASEWKVQVAHDDGFRDVVEERRVPAGTLNFTGRSYAPGTYHLRVIAIDVNRFESPSSSVLRVQIAAPMVLPATEGSDAQRASVRVPQGFFCGLDGAPLASEARLALLPGRAHRLRCATDTAGRNAREHVIPAGLAGLLRREITVAPAAGDSADGAASGSLSLRLRDSESEPVSLLHVEASATHGVVVDPLRETDQRGVYTTTLHWPPGVRACNVRFVVNESLRFEQEARAEQVRVVAPVAHVRSNPERVVIDTLRIAPPRDPDDEEPTNVEE